MSHTSPETQEAQGHDNSSHIEPDDIGVGLLAVIGAMCAVVVVLVAVLLQAWFYNWKRDVSAGWAAAGATSENSAALAVEEQQGQISSYHWADREKRLRAVPVGEAMKLVVAEMAAENNKPGGGK